MSTAPTRTLHGPAGLKTLEDVQVVLDRRLAQHWATWVAAESSPAADTAPAPVDPAADLEATLEATPARFPMRLPLGRADGKELERSFVEVLAWARTWKEAALSGAEVVWEPRSIHGTSHQLPRALILNTLDAAAELAGDNWPATITLARSRWATLKGLFPSTSSASALRTCGSWDDTQFGMLTATALWLRDNDPAGLTARQVPVEGVHGKWLNQHQALVTALAGRKELGLAIRPTRVHFAYLDPGYLASGPRQRRHDSLTLGDSAQPAYEPDLVIICENKDTAILFPPVPGAISVEGNGWAAVRLLPQVPWIARARRVVYWGDIDTAGFEILDALRAAGIRAESILMDRATYDTYWRFGAMTDSAGAPLGAVDPKLMPNLTEAERELYLLLCSPEWDGPRRIEQERIPLTAARVQS